MWLQTPIGHLIQTRLLEEGVFNPNSDDCVQASWQGPFLFQKYHVHGIWGRGKLILDPNSDDGVQAPWQEPFRFPEMTHAWISRPI